MRVLDGLAARSLTCYLQNASATVFDCKHGFCMVAGIEMRYAGGSLGSPMLGLAGFLNRGAAMSAYGRSYRDREDSDPL